MAKAIKQYVPEFLFAGRYGDPAPELLSRCKHIKPNNDVQERAFGIVDNRVHKNPNESTEKTDARLKMLLNRPMLELEALGDEKANEAWRAARALRSKRVREETDQKRRQEFQDAKLERLRQRQQKRSKKNEKAKEIKQQFQGVQAVRTKADLDTLLRDLSPQLTKQVLRAQVQQLTKMHGVSTRLLPLKQNGKRLEADALYANLTALLAHGDPTNSAAQRAMQMTRKAPPHRGRPRASNARPRKQRKIDENEFDEDWMIE